MIRIMTTLIVLVSLSACTTTSSTSTSTSGSVSLGLTEIAPGCRALADNGEVVTAVIAGKRKAWVTGKCPNMPDKPYELARVKDIRLFSAYAKIRISDKLGERDLVMRRSYNPYKRERFRYMVVWINKA